MSVTSPVIGPHVLGECALTANGRGGAVIGPREAIAWMCVPGWEDPAVLACSLSGRGVFSVPPQGGYVWGRPGESGSLIWRSRWVTETGSPSRDALAFLSEFGRAVVLRRIVAVRGPARVEVVCPPSADCGRTAARRVRLEGDGCRGRVGDAHFALSGAATAAPERCHSLSFQLELGR